MALELQNEMDQEIHRDNLSIHASNKMAEGQLRSREATQAVEGDIHLGIDSASTLKGLYTGYSVGSNVYQAGGVGKFVTQEIGKTKAFAQPAIDKASGMAMDKVSSVKARFASPAAKAFEATPEQIQSMREGRATAKAAGLVHVGGGVYKSTPAPAVPDEPLPTRIKSEPVEDGDAISHLFGESTSADHASTTTVDTVGKALGTLAEETKAPKTLFQAVRSGVSSVGNISTKALGAAGGALDVVEDVAHGGLYGNNMEKAGNVLTIASTVLDFVPGMEWAGALGGIVATGLNVAGDRKENDVQHDQDKAAKRNVDTPTERTASLAQRGAISQVSQDAVHQIQGSNTF